MVHVLVVDKSHGIVRIHHHLSGRPGQARPGREQKAKQQKNGRYEEGIVPEAAWI